MGYSEGAPSWVIQRRAEAEASSLNAQMHQLREKVKALEEENNRLKKQLDEANRKYEECAAELDEKDRK